MIGNKFSNFIISTFMKNIGGAYLLIDSSKANAIKMKEITNPSLEFV